MAFALHEAILRIRPLQYENAHEIQSLWEITAYRTLFWYGIMTYTVTIRLEEEEVHTEDAKTVVNYIGEVLARMGYSYQISCQRDGMKMMMGRQSPSAQDSG
jgi:hypothetical protein